MINITMMTRLKETHPEILRIKKALVFFRKESPCENSHVIKKQPRTRDRS